MGKRQETEIAKVDARVLGKTVLEDSGFLDAIEPSQAKNELWDKQRRAFTVNGAIEPIYDKDLLCRTVARSGPIQENIGVYECAIEGFGFDLIPVLDPDAEGAFAQVKTSMWERKIQERDKLFEMAVMEWEPSEAGEELDEGKIFATFSTDEELEPSEEEVLSELEEIRRDIELQKLRAQRFFKNAARIDGKPVSFVTLRKVLRRDLETMGECFAEVIRDSRGKIRRFAHIKSVSVRKLPMYDNDTREGAKQIEVLVPERVDPFTIEFVKEWRAFRRYIQVDPETLVVTYFKQFGDPRVMSGRTGRFYKSNEELQREEGNSEPLEPKVPEANELIEWEIYDPESIYGTPRWMALSPEISGHRKASEINFLWFDNKGIPPFLVTVSGGQLSREADKRVAEHLKSLKGSDNYHKILVLEAAPFSAATIPGMAPQTVKIEVQPLIKHMPEDALYQNYQTNNEERVSALFRNPPMLRGRAQEYTRATSREATKFFEQFVSTPERHRFDDPMNHEILPHLGITLLLFKSRGPDTTDPEVFTKVLDMLAKHGGVVPRDVRQEAERLLGRELGKYKLPWANIPLQLTTVGISSGAIFPPGSEQLRIDPTENQNIEPQEQQIEEPQSEVESQEKRQARTKRVKELRKAIRKSASKDLYEGGRANTWFNQETIP